MASKNPNLFDFATSELSQDAFLCWMAALALHEDVDLQRVGRGFIAWLWQRARGASVEPARVQLLALPQRQVERIDILFEADVAGAKALFLIEDKTDTSHHSHQLERYREAMKHAETVVPIYFKTGYHFGTDTTAAAAGYTIIGLREWVEFLDAQTVRNDILHDYRSNARRLLVERDEALDALMTPRGFDHFIKDFVQYEFMQLLAEACGDFVARRAVYRGRGLGGDPWAQYLFAEFDDALPGNVKENLFYRVDRRAGGWYLSLRQHARVKGTSEAQALKLRRLKAYRDLFRQVAEVAGAADWFGRPSTDNRGKNESEIAVLFFNEATNTTRTVLELMPAVHRAFVARIASGVLAESHHPG
jgi:hypothetical protein